MLTTLQRNAANPPPPAMDDGSLFVIIAIYGIAIIGGLIINILFLMTLSKCFRQIAPKNRQMEPGQVWLCLIPLFGVVWTIITILRLSDSLSDEYEERGLPADGDFGKTLGLVYFISAFVCGCVSLVAFVMYWMKIAGYNKILAESAGRSGRSRRRDDDDDADDDRRRSDD